MEQEDNGCKAGLIQERAELTDGHFTVKGRIRKVMHHIGKSEKRREDLRLITGRGTFLDDVILPGLLHTAILRSNFPHARITRIDFDAAKKLQGVIGVLTGPEAQRMANPMPVLFQVPGAKIPRYYCLAVERVRFVGEPVVAVAATNRYVARDALELIDVDYERLPSLLDAETAMQSSIQLHEEIENNVYHYLNIKAGNIERALAEADIVIERKFTIGRQAGTPLEPHGVIADYDPHSRFLTVWSATQIPHGLRIALSSTLGIPQHKIRVIANDVGGGFGTHKYHPEDILVCLLSIKTGRPVKWIGDRREIFLGGYHAREQKHQVVVAASKDGVIQGLSDKIIADMGAYLPRESTGPPNLTALALPGPYKVPNFSVDLYCIATNKAPSGAYRGFGNPQANFVIERIMDIVARELMIDSAEIRLRNMIEKTEFPYRTVTGLVYDSGNYKECLERCLELVRYAEWRERQRNLRKQGRYIGIGMSFYLEQTGNVIGTVHGGHDSVTIRFDPSGGATVLTGLMPHGQGSETTLAQVAADALGLNLEDIRVVFGDTSLCPYGHGTFASRSAAIGSGGIILAAEKIREKALRVASSVLGVRLEDLEFREGTIHARGFPDKSISLKEIARIANYAHRLPMDIEPGLEATAFYNMPSVSHSYGVHIAAVEVDFESLSVRIPAYAVVHDCGLPINLMVIEGQIHGGIAQGIGGALMEQLVYDDNGQLLTSTFADYLIPTPVDMPANIIVDHMETLSPTHPLGVKGGGQGSVMPPAAILANALEDAFQGSEMNKLPIDCETRWSLLKKFSNLLDS